jgi:hypothetical protein
VISRLMAAQSFNLALDGGAMPKIRADGGAKHQSCAQWRHDGRTRGELVQFMEHHLREEELKER